MIIYREQIHPGNIFVSIMAWRQRYQSTSLCCILLPHALAQRGSELSSSMFPCNIIKQLLDPLLAIKKCPDNVAVLFGKKSYTHLFSDLMLRVAKYYSVGLSIKNVNWKGHLDPSADCRPCSTPCAIPVVCLFVRGSSICRQTGNRQITMLVSVYYLLYVATIELHGFKSKSQNSHPLILSRSFFLLPSTKHSGELVRSSARSVTKHVSTKLANRKCHELKRKDIWDP